MTYYVQIPQTTLDANGLFINLGMLTTVNITMVNGSQTNCIITLTGTNGIGHTYNLNAGNPLLIKRAEIISLKATGNGAVIAGVLSWPNEVDPSSITISQPISIGSSVTLPTQEVLTPNIYTGQIAASSNTISPVSSGYAWKIESIAMTWVADSTASASPQISYIPNGAPFNSFTNVSAANQSVYTIVFFTLSETLNDIYSVLLSTISQNKSNSLVGSIYTTLINLPREITMFSGDQLYLSTGGNTKAFSYAIQYTQYTTGTVT